MRIAEGVNSLLQMAAMLARLCKKSGTPSALGWIYTVLHVSTKNSFLWMSEVQIFPSFINGQILFMIKMSYYLIDSQTCPSGHLY